MMRDFLAGLSVAGLLLPSAIAYAAIAGLPPSAAIIATLAGLAAYPLLGRSRFAMVAPTSSSAAILAALLTSQQAQGANPAAVTQAAVLAAGICFTAAGAARLGALAGFISRPVLHGFTLGVAVTITIKQLPALTGIPPVGHGTLPLALHMLLALPHWHPLALLLGIAAFAALVLLRRVPNLPAAALVLAAGIALGPFAKACNIASVGQLSLHFPAFAWPDLSATNWNGVAELALPLFLILFAESWGSIRGLALPHGDKISTNRELLALGGANLLSGICQGMPVGAGFSASAAAESAGARTRLAGIFALAVIAALAISGRALIALLPQPVLAAIVIASLTHALNPTPLLALWRRRRDHIVATTAFAAVLLLGVLDGMLFAVAFSVLALLRRLSGTAMAELGRLPNSGDFADLARHPEAETYPALRILRPSEPLFFANAESILLRVTQLAATPQLILSLEESPDLDSTALDALTECDAALAKSGHRLILARVKDPVRDAIAQTAPDLAARCYHSVMDAVRAAA